VNKMNPVNLRTCGFDSLEISYWLFVPKFAGSHPTETVRILRAKNSPARLPSEGK
jgi:hypothetical protein